MGVCKKGQKGEKEGGREVERERDLPASNEDRQDLTGNIISAVC